MLTYIAFGKSVDGSLILQNFVFEYEQIYWSSFMQRFYVLVEFISKVWGIFMITVTIFCWRSKCVFKLNNNSWNFQTACLSPNKCRIIRLVNKTTGYRAFDCSIILLMELVQWHHRKHRISFLKTKMSYKEVFKHIVINNF